MDRKLNKETEHANSGVKRKGQRLELSVPQVAGSALAAVAAAVLASQLGVYGTIVGAGVVSVIATCGGTIFQHLFRRTGEQLREVTVQGRPRARQVPVRRGDGDPAAAWMPPLTAATGDEFGAATTHGTRMRGWKRPVLAAVVAFAVAMVGITAFELLSGRDLSGGNGTTVGSVVGGGNDRPGPSETPATTPSPGGRQSPAPDNTGGAGSSRSPGDGQSGGTEAPGDVPTQPPPTGPSGSGSAPTQPGNPTPPPTRAPTQLPSGGPGGAGGGTDNGTGNGTGNGTENGEGDGGVNGGDGGSQGFGPGTFGQ